MPKYRVFIPIPATLTVVVEAEDAEDAIEAAGEHVHVDLCAQCSGWGEDYNLDLPIDWDWDGADVEEVQS